ncbi:8960_t:CDS:1, partial [Gigaspora margarita]
MNTEQFQQFIEIIAKSLKSQNRNNAALKENNVKCFYSTDEEDPFEWFNNFECAFEANKWI